MNRETVETRRPDSPCSEHVAVGPDGFIYAADAPSAFAHRYLDVYLAVCLASGPETWRHQRLERLLSEVERACGVRELSCPAIVCATIERMAWVYTNRRDVAGQPWDDMLHRLCSHLFYDRDCSQATYSPEQIDHLLRLLIASERLMGSWWSALLPAVERGVREYPLTPERRRLVWAYVDTVVLTGMDFGLGPDDEHVLGLARLDELTEHVPSGLMRAGEPWADVALADMAALPDAQRGAWESFLEHALTATVSRPTKTWLRQASEHIDAIGWRAVEGRLIGWFEAATRPATLPMHDRNATILRGLIWCCAPHDAEQLVQAIGQLAEAMFMKVGFSARCLKAGNACLYTLSMIPGMASIAQLARLKRRINGHGAQDTVQKALAAAADRAGLPRDEIEELVVPTFDLDAQGRRCAVIDGYTAEISIVGTERVRMRWLSADGTAQTSVPTSVKAEYAGEVKALKRTVDEMRQALATQRNRLEGLFVFDRSWLLAVWRERYLDHPLLGQMCRRLIWHLSTGDRTVLATWNDGRLVDLADHPLDWLTDETRVRLWHPIGCDPETVLRWRLWLEEHGVTQPFKQAHREVYLLTDAERATRTYSNRFAAHILQQRQLYALCQQRGWRYSVQGPFDSGGDVGARRELPQWGLRAEFWIDAVEGRAEESVEGGLFRYVSTDQVRFSALRGEGAPRPLEGIPPVVFSEVMRDVDLFVSVCSIGTDPTWQDRGEGYGDYWQSYAFGDLSASALTRREVLARLLPQLTLADRCHLGGRFLVVRGDLRTYKIHLGSGNVLMEPNDQYLCIVPDRRGAARDGDHVFLPFEGDSTLSLIVSKAVLLAHDTTIKDPTIMRQIRLS